MTTPKTKAKPARVRVPALYRELSRLHWQIHYSHRPGTQAMLQIEAILETIIATKEPRKLHANLCALFGIEVGAHRPALVDACDASLHFIVDRYNSGQWDADRCRELLGLSRLDFDRIVAEHNARDQERREALAAKAQANGGKLSAADY